MRTPARTRASDDVRLAVTVHIYYGHTAATIEGRSIGEEVINDRGSRISLQRPATKRPNLRTPVSIGPGDDVGPAIAIDVACGHENASKVTEVVGEKLL